MCLSSWKTNYNLFTFTVPIFNFEFQVDGRMLCVYLSIDIICYRVTDWNIEFSNVLIRHSRFTVFNCLSLNSDDHCKFFDYQCSYFGNCFWFSFWSINFFCCGRPSPILKIYYYWCSSRLCTKYTHTSFLLFIKDFISSFIT